MTTYIQTDHFTNPLHTLLDETFDNVHGAYLDKGTSLFETLATISAAEASAPVGGRCATLAAQVKHMAFYLDVLEGSFERSSSNGRTGARSGGRRARSRPKNGRRSSRRCAKAMTASRR